MDVLLLGTGAADGIPNVFCDCATCADYRSRGELRTPTSILVDWHLLIDPGPESPRQVSRLGRDLTECSVILVGHAHSDHLDASLLMHRSWVRATPLTLAGPAPVTKMSAQWVDPEQTAIEFVTLTAGMDLTISGYRIEALAANHAAYGEALCYRISKDDHSMLYLTDTGPLPPATLQALNRRRVDLVLLEETFGYSEDKSNGHHHNLHDFATTIGALTRRGVVDSFTRVVPIHIGHDNPPLTELQEAMGEFGAEVLPDGALIHIGV